MRPFLSMAAVLLLVVYSLFTARAQEPTGGSEDAAATGADLAAPEVPPDEVPASQIDADGRSGGDGQSDEVIAPPDEPGGPAVAAEVGHPADPSVPSPKPPEPPLVPVGEQRTFPSVHSSKLSDPMPKYLASTNVIVSVSENGEAVWGFSKSIGKWTKKEIQPAVKHGLVPILSGNIAGMKVGNAIYAYSGQTGRWDILRLPDDRKPRMSVDADMVIVTDERNIYTFANSTGRWSSRDATATEPSNTDKPSGKIVVFHLKYADAQPAVGVLGRLFNDVTVFADQRLNTLIVRADSQEDLSKFEAVLKQLDQPIPDRPQSSDAHAAYRAGLDYLRSNASGQHAKALGIYRELKQQTVRLAQLADQQRRQSSDATETPGDAKALKQQLADAVVDEFEARQALQRAELAQLRQRLARVEHQIIARERIKDAIISHRVEELLNPELRWEDDRESMARPGSSPRSQMLGRTTGEADPFGRPDRMSALQGIAVQKGLAVQKLMGPQLLFFHADWCATCQKLKTRIKKLQGEGLKILDVNVTDQSNLSESRRAFQVDSVPTLILCIDGLEAGRVTNSDIDPLVDRYQRGSSGAGPQPEARDAGASHLSTLQKIVAIRPTEDADIRGRWKVTDVKIPASLLSGDALKKDESLAVPPDEFLKSEVLITADKYILWPVQHMGLPDALKAAVTYAVDEKKKPNTIDLMQKGKMITRGIYKLEGDRLQVHFDLLPDRPVDFEFKPEGTATLLTLKRIAFLDNLFLDITITGNGAAEIEGRETDEKSLGETLRFLLELNPNLRVHLSTHPDTAQQHVARGIERIQAAGVSAISGAPADAEAHVPDYTDNPADVTLAQAIQQMTIRLAEARTLYGPQHPKVKAIESQLGSLGVIQAAETPRAPALILRSAEEFGRRLHEAEKKLKRTIQLRERGDANDASVQSSRRQLTLIRDEYAAQVRLLELELQEVQMASEAPALKYEYHKERREAGLISKTELLKAKQEAHTAKLRVDRVKTLLELYLKAGQTSPPQPKPVGEDLPADGT